MKFRTSSKRGLKSERVFQNVEDLAVEEPEKGINKGWVGQVCNQVGDSHLPKCSKGES